MENWMWIFCWSVVFGLALYQVLSTCYPYCLSCLNGKKRATFWSPDHTGGAGHISNQEEEDV